MGYDRLRGVLVAQQKVVPNERLAGLVSGEGGRRVGFESQSIYSLFCPGDGIGIRVGLRNQILGVRLSSEAPVDSP